MVSSFNRIKVLIIVVLTTAGFLAWSLPFDQETGLLEVRFLDIGQGDAIHIKTPDGYEVLIDGGATAAVLRQLAIGRNFFDRKIDLIVATHPDTDHVGGLVDVLERYQVDNILMTNVNHDAAAARAFERAAVAEPGAGVIYATAGQIIKLGASTTLKVLSPRGDVTNWQSNNASIVLQLVYGDIEFMLTGDASENIENYLVTLHGHYLESEVLKLGHHGSDTSTSEKFLQTVSPIFAVVSAGRDNRYGHPSSEVIERVDDFGAVIVSTAEQGTIEFNTDGIEVWLVD